MKKTKFILTVSGILCAMALTGCNANVALSEPQSGEPLSINIEITEPESTVTTNEAVTSTVETTTTNQTTAPVTEVVTTNQTDAFIVETIPVSQTNVPEEFVEVIDAQEREEGYAGNFNYIVDDTNNIEYAIVTGIKEDGSEWIYETSTCEVAQYCRMQWIDSFGGMTYINEAGYITALDSTTGNVLWCNPIYVGGGVLTTVDENGTLYVVGNDMVALLVIDKNGETIINVEQFADYTMPYNMYIHNDTLTILYDCADNAAVEMNINDYSYIIR